MTTFLIPTLNGYPKWILDQLGPDTKSYFFLVRAAYIESRKVTLMITSQNFNQKNINFPRGCSRLDLKSRNASISELHNWLKPIDILMVYISIFTLIYAFSI